MSDPPDYPSASEIRWASPISEPLQPKSLDMSRVFQTATDLALADAVAEILELQSQLASAVLLTKQYREMLSSALTRLHELQVRDGE